MLNPVQLEDRYQEFIGDLTRWIPDGIDIVDLGYLKQYDLLKEANHHLNNVELPITHYFHVIETSEKITLFNDQFVVWIVPQLIDGTSVTYTLIALIDRGHPQLEKLFCTAGVYNSSRIVLRLLEKILDEIQETEELLFRINH